MNPSSSERLGRHRRLRSSRDFEAVKRGGTPHRGRFCVLLVLACPGEPTRVGFVASKRGVGGAVQRNRARRRFREIVRRRFPRLPVTGYSLVIIASSAALSASHQELASDVERVLAAAGALAPIQGTLES
ncbi:MAG: ribonuclease P protein component [Candidatus Eiseniibacteriota bacterium]